jgi:hypothetical protein
VSFPDLGASVQIELNDTDATFTEFSVKINFYEWEADYDCLVQEIFLPGGTMLVEVFMMENGQQLSCRYDHHSASTDNDFYGVHHRRMFVYPANVEGVDWDYNFGHLPENMDGSVKTNISATFNERYQKKHKTQGKVVSDRRDIGFWWSIEWKNGNVTVQIPEDHRYTAK